MTECQIRFSRVYDSRILDNADFGPGWRLSLVSELFLEGDRLIFVDGSGARYEFRRHQDGRYMGTLPEHDGVDVTIRGNEAMWTRYGKLTRRYHRRGVDASFLIVRRLFDHGAFLQYEYEDGLLKSLVDPNGLAIRMERGAHGRVNRAIDRNGRLVTYRYDANGRLQAVRDVAGNEWEYRYGERGTLTTAIGPNGNAILRAGYDEDGRVAESQTGRTSFYTYSPLETVVTRDGGQIYRFEQDAEGATVALQSTVGTAWRIKFNSQRRVHQLLRPDSSYFFFYERAGRRVSKIVEKATDDIHLTG